MLPKTLEWLEGRRELLLLDQRLLPHSVEFKACRTCGDVACAIEDMTVRGAPAIGVAAAYGVALAAISGEDLDGAFERLARTRPTAVSLFRVLERIKKMVGKCTDKNKLSEALLCEAKKIHNEDLEINRRLGYNGQLLLPMFATVITHCNAGALATSGYGTALGVFRAAKERGKTLKIYVDETRPRLQGGALTSFELKEDGFDVTVICDSMAAYLMSVRHVDAIVTGADRIAGNGDTANKIGTYALAIAAEAHGVPFYIAAPMSTVDFNCVSGRDIPIEERPSSEVSEFGGQKVLPKDVPVWNPAFDVTPARYIKRIITETGVFSPGELARLKGVACNEE